MANHTWSPQQQAIFDWATNGRGSAVVIAVAGAGKTATIVELARIIMVQNPRVYACFVAFNKSIAEELKTRLPQSVRAMTLNGMGFSAWLRHLGNVKVEVTANKVRDITRRLLSPEQAEVYGAILPKLVALAKGAGILPARIQGDYPGVGTTLVGLTRDTDAAWQAMIEHHQLDVENELEAIDLARKVLAENICMGKEVVDFDDQLYLPIIHSARFFQNDWLMVDEAQDVNKIQRAMLKRALRPGGRLVAVGDPAQAIYGFRGADTSSIDNIKREFGACELPLTVSYRCPQAVVREAQRFVSHIQATDTAPMGKVETLGKYGHGMFMPADAILCRNTAPIVDMAFSFIRKQVACRVLGRQIGEGLIALVKKMKSKTLDGLSERLLAHQEREIAKFMAKGEEQKADALVDRITTLFVFIDNLTEERRTIPALVERIESLFTDNNKGILTLCTVHKSKGLEFPRVFILDADELMPSKWARQEWQQEQEKNLQYVAATRAKEELYYITSKGLVG